MGHLTTQLFNIPNELFFVRDRMEGKSSPKGFTHKQTGNPLEDPNVPLQGLESLVQAIQDLAGKEAGPGDEFLKEKINQHANRE